eukprot:gene6780-biopygen5967
MCDGPVVPKRAPVGNFGVPHVPRAADLEHGRPPRRRPRRVRQPRDLLLGRRGRPEVHQRAVVALPPAVTLAGRNDNARGPDAARTL